MLANTAGPSNDTGSCQFETKALTTLPTRNLQPIVVGSRPLVAGSLYAYGHTLHTELGRQAHQAYAKVDKHLWPPSGKKNM